MQGRKEGLREGGRAIKDEEEGREGREAAKMGRREKRQSQE